MKNLIGRTSVPKEPKNDVHACEDFLNVIVDGHVVAASKKIRQFDRCNEVDDPSEKYSLFIEGVKELVKNYVHGFLLLDCNEECEDKIQTYGKHVLTCGLLFKEFVDGIKEGDGLRVLRCWRFFLSQEIG